MLVTQVQKGIGIFYLCDKHFKVAKVYNPDLVIIETGDSFCDKCKEEANSSPQQS